MSNLLPSDTTLSLLAQVPLVGIFIWFALTLIKHFTGSMERRDKQWQNFFEEQRLAYHKSITSLTSRFGEEIRSLAKEIAELRGQRKA